MKSRKGLATYNVAKLDKILRNEKKNKIANKDET